MNGAHWHLLINHFPIIFPVVGVIIMVTSLFLKSELVKRIAYMIFILAALASIVVMSSGEGAEEVVESINGISENYIHIHEEAAEIFALLTYLLGGLSLLGLWASIKKKSFSFALSVATLLLTGVVLYFAKETGTSGGEIRHTEIRNGNNAPAADVHTENESDE